MPLRLGIQTKVVGTLVLAGLVPLIAGLAFLLIVVFRVRTSGVGESFQHDAVQHANHIATMLASQAEFAYLINQLPGTREFLLEASRQTPFTQQQIDEIERQWTDLSINDLPLSEILNNPLAQRWQAVRQQRIRFAEVLVTDATGRLIAATNKTSDFFQADEPWWRRCYAGGQGKLFMTNIRWDDSALSASGASGALVADLCLPMHGPDGRVNGITKISLDAGWLGAQLDTWTSPGFADVKLDLIHADGTPAQSRPGTAPAIAISSEIIERLTETDTAWFVRRRYGDDIVAFARVVLPFGRFDIEHELDWYVVVWASRRQTLAPLYRLTWLMLGGGVVVIALCFITGLMIARREIIRPLRLLRRAVAELEAGNLSYRLPIGLTPQEHGEFRNDEIADLARQFNRMADELQSNVHRLEQADMVKQQFIDVASHELRTPVTYILGATQLAERQQDHNPLLAKIHAKASRLARIVDNMAKLLRSGSYYSTLHLERVDLAALVHAVAQELSPFMDERRQKWEIKAAEHVPIIEADADKLKDVLSNLMSNAIRFSPDGSTVRVELAPKDDGVEVVVCDRGAGIPAEDVVSLFEPFSPVKSEVMRHTSGEFAFGTQGIGLGLTVVKRFVELHGGKVSVETSPAGTKMKVWLPAHPAAAPVNDLAPLRLPPTDGAK